MNNNSVLIVNRDDLRQCGVLPTAISKPGDGDALLRIETFGLSSNNITYLALGDTMPYREFFPVRDESMGAGWCCPPVWGVGNVVESKSPTLNTGHRVYGFFPAARFVTLKPAEATPGGFRVERSHIPRKFALYHQYGVLGRDPFFLPEQEEMMVVMRPLFLTGLLLDDYLREVEFGGASRVFVSSAASKTAYGFASAFSRSRGAELIGLASLASRDAAQGFDFYDRVVVYEEIDSLATDPPTIYVDISGSVAIRQRVVDHLEDGLKLIVSVGLTHWADGNYGSGDKEVGPRAEAFFAPGWSARRMREQGPAFLGGLLAGWQGQMEHVDRHFVVARESGSDSVVASYCAFAEGRIDPNRAVVHDL